MLVLKQSKFGDYQANGFIAGEEFRAAAGDRRKLAAQLEVTIRQPPVAGPASI